MSAGDLDGGPHRWKPLPGVPGLADLPVSDPNWSLHVEVLDKLPSSAVTELLEYWWTQPDCERSILALPLGKRRSKVVVSFDRLDAGLRQALWTEESGRRERACWCTAPVPQKRCERFFLACGPTDADVLRP